MKRIIIIIVTIVILSFLIIPTAKASENVPLNVLNAKNSVVRIEINTATSIYSGTGFIINNNKDTTYIVTNYHVVKDNMKAVSIWISKDEKVAATVIAFNEQKDLAVLKPNHMITGDALPLSMNATQGNSIYTIGFPVAADSLSDSEAHKSNEATITDGIISSIRSMKVLDYGSEVRILQISAAINSGNSGGPLLNVNGEVLGINTYGVTNAQGIYGAIDISELISFLEISNIPFVKNNHINENTSWIIWIGVIFIFFIFFVIVDLSAEIQILSSNFVP